MNNKLEDLINQGQKFNFGNNSYRSSNDTFSRASDELLAWIANVEHYIIENYEENSGPFNLFKTYKKSELSGNYSDSFEKQLGIIRATLIACRQIPPKRKSRWSKDDNLILSLIKNPLFWVTSVVIIGASYSLGLNFGSSRFDKEKNDFYEENKALKIEIQKAAKEVEMKNSEIEALKDKVNLLNTRIKDN